LQLMPISVVIIEDDVHYNHALKKIIDYEAGMSCVGQCFSGREAIRQLPALHPDVAIVDINLKGMNGIEVMEQTKEACPRTQFIMCTCFEDDQNILKSLRAGAVGYLVKGENMEKIVASIREVNRGGVPLTAAVARRILQQFNPANELVAPQMLTKTENEILLLLAQGLSSREIACKKFISIDTVRKHASNSYRKLGVRNKVEAINKIRGLS